MWDVKFLCTNVFTVCVEVFYLNYVGCKVVSLEKLISFWVEFYLNYVGCKGKAEERRDKTASVISFYLNYVGCKGGSM